MSPVPGSQNSSFRHWQRLRLQETATSSGLCTRCSSTCGERTQEYLRLRYERRWRSGNPEKRVTGSNKGDISSPGVFAFQLTCSRTHITPNSVPTRLTFCQLTFFMITKSALGRTCVHTTSGSSMQLAEGQSMSSMHGEFSSLHAGLRRVTHYNTDFVRSPPLAVTPFENSEGVSPL